MVEIVVVAGILCGAMGMLLVWQRSSVTTSQLSAREQEYANQLSLLAARVRADVRAAAAISHPQPDTWVLEVWRQPEHGLPVREEVRYTVSGDRKIVTRSGAGRQFTFNFSNLMEGGKRFVFSITP